MSAREELLEAGRRGLEAVTWHTTEDMTAAVLDAILARRDLLLAALDGEPHVIHWDEGPDGETYWRFPIDLSEGT